MIKIEAINLMSFAGIWNSAWPVILAVVLFLIMIVIHELGHFVAAKLLGVRVNEFSVGFGPTIFKKQGKETLYSFRLVPFGGFCAMEGEDDESADERAFCNKAPWRRFIIVAAGAVFNIIFGFILAACIVVPQDAYASTTVSRFSDTAVSDSAGGLMVGDKILKINGRKVATSFEMSYNFTNIKGDITPLEVSDFEQNSVQTVDTVALEMVVERDGEKVTLPAVPFAYEESDGIRFVKLDFWVQPIERTFLTALDQTFKTTFSYIKIVLWSLVDLLSGKYGLSAMGGPVAVADSLSQAAKSGLSSLLPMLCLITINLGVFNLLPVPALDGGRLFFILIEMIFRRPIAKKFEPYVHAAGLVILLGLIGVVTINDIIRLIKG